MTAPDHRRRKPYGGVWSSAATATATDGQLSTHTREMVNLAHKWEAQLTTTIS
jgi:hypothetical protein